MMLLILQETDLFFSSNILSSTTKNICCVFSTLLTYLLICGCVINNGSIFFISFVSYEAFCIRFFVSVIEKLIGYRHFYNIHPFYVDSCIKAAILLFFNFAIIEF